MLQEKFFYLFIFRNFGLPFTFDFFISGMLIIAVVALVVSGALSIATKHSDQITRNFVGTRGNAA